MILLRRKNIKPMKSLINPFAMFKINREETILV